MTGNLPDEWFRPEGAETTPSIPAVRSGNSPSETTGQTAAVVSPPLPPPPASPAKKPVRKSNRRTRVLLVATIVGALAIGWLVGQILQNAGSSPGAGLAASSTATDAQSSDLDPSLVGTLGPVEPTAVMATCIADEATDSVGRTVTYEPEKALDGDKGTAWRCPGMGDGVMLAFTFPDGTVLSQVGLINGYPKRDPVTGDSMYLQYRRVTKVTWDFGGGRTVVQKLDPEQPDLQLLDVPEVKVTGPVTLTIDASSDPGWASEKSRNAVLISEVDFYEISG